MHSCVVPTTGIAAEPQLAPDWTLSTAGGQAIILAAEAEKQNVVLLSWPRTGRPRFEKASIRLKGLPIEYKRI
jgi:hypothetical protein